MNKIFLCLVSFLLITFYLSEGFGKIHFLLNWERSPVQIIIKLLVLPIIVPHLLIFKKQLVIILAVFLCFLIGQLSIDNGFESNILINSSKYIYFLIFLSFFSVHKEKLIDTNWQFTLEAIAVINSILILAGFIFKLSFFETYTGQRFGYNGLLVSSATSSYFHFFIMSHFLMKLRKDFFKNLPVLLIISTSLFIGTKSVYLLNIIFIFLYVFLFTNSRQKIVSFTVLSLAFISFLIYTLFFWPLFRELTISNGLLASLSSLRSQLLTNKTIPFLLEYWGFENILFGGILNISLRPQLGFIDLFLFFGLIGSFFFFKSFLKSFFSIINSTFVPLLVYILFSMIFMTGNFFLNTSICIYTVVFLYSYAFYTEERRIS